MKKLFSTMGLGLLLTLFTAFAYANPYIVVLKEAPAEISQGNIGYIVYQVSTEQYARPLAGLRSVPFGTAQTSFNPDPSKYDRICGNPFNLGAPGDVTNTCYLVLVANSEFFPDGGAITGAPVICDYPPSGNCFTFDSQAVNIPIVPTQVNISVSPTSIVLTGGSHAKWTITNNSGSDTADQVGVTFNTINADFINVVSTGCNSIPALGTCTIEGDVRNPPKKVTQPSGVPVDFAGSNTNTATVQVAVLDGSSVLAPVGSEDIVIETPAPDVYCSTWQNTLSAPNTITINSVTANPTAAITLDASTTCTGVIAPQATCQVCYNGTTAANGSAPYTINYTPLGGSATNTGGEVIVVPTDITITPSPIDIPSNSSSGAPVPYQVNVVGPFDLQNAHLATVGTISDIVIGVFACEGASIAAGASCGGTYTWGPTPVATSASLQASGSNSSAPAIAPIIVVPSGGPVIKPPANCAEGVHLQYQCITLDNSAESNKYTVTATLSGISTNYVNICSPSDQSCEFRSTCAGTYTTSSITAGSVDPNNSCEIWLRSVTPSDQAFGTQGPGSLVIDAGNSSATFNVYQQLALYATGEFNQAGGSVSVNNIAKYDGSAWSTLDLWPVGHVGSDNGLSGGDGNALSVFRGDLFAGGDFLSANAANTKFIARWNGFKWNSVATSASNQINGTNTHGIIWDLAPMVNNSGVSGTTLPLYIGGQFTSANGTPVRNMAQLLGLTNGNVSLGPIAGKDSGVDDPSLFGFSIVYGLFVNGNSLYTTGDFERTTPQFTGSGSPSNIAVWHQSSVIWSALDDGVNNVIGGGYVSASTQDSGGNVYATGGFLGTFNSFSCGFFDIVTDVSVLKFNGSCWTVADNNDPYPPGFAGEGYDIITYNDTVYASGLFPCRADLSDFGNTPINNVTFLAGGQWQRLGGGLGSLVTIFGTNYCVPSNLLSLNYVTILQAYNGMLYAGGFFDESPAANGNPRITGLHNIAAYPVGSSTNSWQGVGGGVQNTHQATDVNVGDILITSSLLVKQ